MGKTLYNNFVELLKYRAQKQANCIAYTFLVDGENEEVSITYSELDMRAESIANELRKTCNVGDRALLLFPSCLEFISSFFGCLYAGIIPVPAYPPRKNRKIDRLMHIIRDCEARVVLSVGSMFHNTLHTFQKYNVLNGLNWINVDKTENIDFKENKKESIPSNRLAFIQYTSGSTGDPKGIMVSHENLIENAYIQYDSMEYSDKSIVVSWLPFFHDMGLIGIILQSIFGGLLTILMPPEVFISKPVRWLNAISKYRATHSFAPNFAYDLCCETIKDEQLNKLDLSCWKVALNGAEPVNAKTLEVFSQKMKAFGFKDNYHYPGYGLAESTLVVSCPEVLHQTTVLDIDEEKSKSNVIVKVNNSLSRSKRIVGCGYIRGDYHALIVDPDSRTACENGVVGEIWLSGKSVAQGYWKNPKLTKEIFHAYTSDTKEGPFLKTGDLGFFYDNELFITGRLKDVIIIRGRNYYPQDIEYTVSDSHESLISGGAAAFSIETGSEEKLIIIQEVKRTSIKNLNVNEVIEAIKRAIVEEYELQVHDIVLVKPMRLLKTSSGKVQRKANKKVYLESAFEDSIARLISTEALFSVPIQTPINYRNTDIQNQIVNKIADYLKIPKDEININVPFESFGLDSLKAIRLIGELSEEMGKELSPSLVYDFPSIAALSNYLINKGEEIPTYSGKKNSVSQDIAIIGMACRFPGAVDTDSFWELLINEKDAISKMPTCRRKLITDKLPKGGYLTNIDKFDTDFFGISPKEAKFMDPQQRILLELSYSALHSAGINTKDIAGSNTGVFIGISQNDYSNITTKSQHKNSPYLGTGCALSIAANRISYFYNLKGPSLAIDTACSSSLVAIHQAKNSLLNGECELAIVGGVNLNLSTDITNSFEMASLLASDSRCKVFDASADGYVRSEGCGVIILKSLSNAFKDKDCIQGVIKGSAIVQDGRSNGLIAPNGISQKNVIKKALIEANLLPEDLSFIETHGTGTELGDLIEIESIAAVYGKPSTKNELFVSALKANIGHLESAAGIAGVIKSVLCLQNKRLPKQLHFNNPNPHIKWDKLPIKVPVKLTSLSTNNNKPHRAGVSSFGFGGVNAHLILEEAPLVQEKKMVSNASFILTLSAKTSKALAELVEEYKNYLHEHKYSTLSNFCYTSNVSNDDFECRFAVTGSNQGELISKLAGYALDKNSKDPFSRTFGNDLASSKIVFLFAGAGPQYYGMAKELYKNNVTFTSVINECSKLFLRHFNYDIKDILWGDDPELINNTKFTQPAIFSLEVALTKAWMHLGIHPSYLMGHSFGEYAVACIAGIISLEDGVKLIGTRASLMGEITEKGAMLAVFANQEEILPYIKGYSQTVAIAAINTRSSLTLSGKAEKIKEIKDVLDKKGIETRLLKISLASHSPLMKPMLLEFKKVADAVNYSKPKMPIISTVTGNIVKGEMSCSDYWVKHIEQPVRFFEGVSYLLNMKSEIFLEVGPGSSLLGMIAQELNEEIPLVSSIKKDENQYKFWLKSLANIYEAGQNIDWNNYYENTKQHKEQLPSYPFQRKKYWVKLENENNAKTNYLESSKSSIVESLNKGDYNNLAKLLKDTGKLSERFLDALPEVLKLLSIKHKEECIFSSIKDYFYEIQWKQKQDVEPIGSFSKGHYIIFSDTEGVGEKLAKTLHDHDCEYTLVYHSNDFKKLDKEKYLINSNDVQDFWQLFNDVQKNGKLPINHVVYLWSTNINSDQEITSSTIEKAQVLGCNSVVYLIQSLISHSITSKIWLFTRSTQLLTGKEELNIASTPIWGLGKVISLEHPQLSVSLVDLDGQVSKEEKIVQQLIAHNPKESQIAIRSEQVYVSRLVKAFPETTKSIHFDSKATYLITGGLGALGMHSAKWLANNGVKNLVLISRRKPSSSKIVELNSLIESGVAVQTVQADICDFSEISKVFEMVQASNVPLKGIIHAAGVVESTLIRDMDLDQMGKVMNPKVIGSWNLHELSKNIDIDFFLMFSSIAAVWGAARQAHYGAGNYFLDSMASYRKVQGLPAMSINWGAWEGGGMVDRQNLEELNKRGVGSMSPKQGIDVLTHLMKADCTNLVVADIEWDRFKELYGISGQTAFFEEIESNKEKKSITSSAQELDILRQIETAPKNKKLSLLIKFLQKELAKLLEFEDDELPGLDKGFTEMGMDSLLLAKFYSKINKLYPSAISMQDLFDYRNIHSLGKVIIERTDVKKCKEISINEIEF